MIPSTYTPARALTNGVTKSFPFTFKADRASEIQVTLIDTSGNESVQDPSLYTVTFSGPTGGKVDFVTAPDSDHLCLVELAEDLTQQTRFRDQGTFYPELHEKAFDKLTKIAQVMAEKLGRALRIPKTQTGVDAEIPAVVPGYFLGGNLSGDGFAWLPGGGTAPSTIDITKFGADPLGLMDSTGAFAQAKAALGGRKGIIWVGACTALAVNLVLDSSWSGIAIQGQGPGESKLAPSVGYLKPYDPTKPVIQIGDGTANYCAGALLKDLCIFGNNTGQYGLAFKGGAARNFGSNLQIMNFTKRCLSFESAAGVSACTYNKLQSVTIATSVVGADGIYFEDQGNDNNAYTTANVIDGLDVTADNGYQLRVNSANGNFISNAYIQQSYSSLGVLFEKSYSRSPMLFVTNAIMDNASGPSAINCILDVGQDWQTVAAFTARPWTGQVVTTGYTLVTAAKTTGTISAGTLSTLSLTSATGARAGRTVVVMGAGTSGRPHVTTIKSISGTTATLKDAAVTAVAGAVVHIGDNLGDMPFPQDGVNWLSAAGILLAASKMTDLLPIGAKGALWKAGATRNFEPFNSTGTVWDLGGTVHYYMQDDGSNYTVNSITQAGTTVTVTTSANHNGAVGDVIQISGVNEEGINGTWKLESRPSATTMTFTSSVSQTLAGVTGAPTLKVNKISAWRYGNLEVARALRLRKSDGTFADVLFANNGNSQINFQTPDAAGGSLVMQMGTTATTSARYVLLASAGGLYMNGYGAIGIGGNNNDTSMSLYLLKRAAGSPATNAAGGTIFVDSTGALKYTSPGGTTTQVVAGP